MDEIKIFTQNDAVVGYIKCIDGVYGTFTQKKYKSVKNAIKFLKFKEEECEEYDLIKLSQLTQYKVLPAGSLGYLLASCTTVDERLKHVYTPILLGCICCEMAMKIIGEINELKLNKGAIKQLCRDVMSANNNFTLSLKHSLKSDKIYQTLLQRRDEMLNDINMPIVILTLQLDNEVMRQAPNLDYHHLVSEIQTILIICDYIIYYDKGFSNLIAKRSGLDYKTKQDINITKIKSSMNILFNKLLKGCPPINFNGREVNGINNIDLAFKSLDKNILNSKWIDSIR